MANLKQQPVVKRMWIQSMTPGAIIEAWENLRSDEEMQPLANKGWLLEGMG